VYDALESGALAGIGLDVFHTEPFPKADPLLLHPKCVATPHIAGVTKISYENMANYVANNIIRMRNGHPPLGCINEIVY
jgi:D-3-phosphoglycerate dehydrogenase